MPQPQGLILGYDVIGQKDMLYDYIPNIKEFLPLIAEIWMFKNFCRKALNCDAYANTDVIVTIMALCAFMQMS